MKDLKGPKHWDTPRMKLRRFQILPVVPFPHVNWREVTKDIDMWEKEGIKVERMEEQPHQNVCFVGVLEDAKTSTMTKRQKRAFVSGLESLQHHDQVMNGCFGVIDASLPATKNILVVTSSPRIFDHPCIRVCDVGTDACHLEEEAHIDMNELCEGIDLAVIVVRYESPKCTIISGEAFIRPRITCNHQWNEVVTCGHP